MKNLLFLIGIVCSSVFSETENISNFDLNPKLSYNKKTDIISIHFGEFKFNNHDVKPKEVETIVYKLNGNDTIKDYHFSSIGLFDSSTYDVNIFIGRERTKYLIKTKTIYHFVESDWSYLEIDRRLESSSIHKHRQQINKINKRNFDILGRLK